MPMECDRRLLVGRSWQHPAQQVSFTASRSAVRAAPSPLMSEATGAKVAADGEADAADRSDDSEAAACFTPSTSLEYWSFASAFTLVRSDRTWARSFCSSDSPERLTSTALTSSTEAFSESTLEHTAGVSSPPQPAKTLDASTVPTIRAARFVRFIQGPSTRTESSASSRTDEFAWVVSRGTLTRGGEAAADTGARPSREATVISRSSGVSAFAPTPRTLANTPWTVQTMNHLHHIPGVAQAGSTRQDSHEPLLRLASGRSEVSRCRACIRHRRSSNRDPPKVNVRFR